MRDYLINSNTLAIIPLDSKKSMVYEKDSSFIVNRNPNFIINRNCILHGSSIVGRLKATQILTGYTYKAPILISEKDNLIFFPTSSPRLKSVSWINLSSIERCYYSISKNMTSIKFNNNKVIDFDISISIMNNQILRATRLESQIRKNMPLNQ